MKGGQDYDLIILGAGVVGVCTAYWAQRAGLSTAVIERQPAPALETSFANGGQIAVSHAEPWANPTALRRILKWLGESDAPLLFRPRLDWWQWRWIASFLVNCTRERAAANTGRIVELAVRSRDMLREIREREHFDYDQKTLGIAHFFRDRKELDAALHTAEIMSRHGCTTRMLTVDELVELEPAFADSRSQLAGASYSPDDESGDAYRFTVALAERCASMGVDFHYGTEALALETDTMAKNIAGVECRGPRGYLSYRARDVAVSLGSYSAPFLRPVGIRLNIYPAKGYSITVPTGDGDYCPAVSLTDDEYKLVYSRLGDRLRVAGTAELSGYDRTLNRRRCEAIVRNVQQMFPRAGRFDEVQYWAGLRPATPTNLPYLGRKKYDNLWLNTGHGTLGWTLGAGSGKRLVEELSVARGLHP
jgi:D-amino-acid dehydrogenase